MNMSKHPESVYVCCLHVARMLHDQEREGNASLVRTFLCVGVRKPILAHGFPPIPNPKLILVRIHVPYGTGEKSSTYYTVV